MIGSDTAPVPGRPAPSVPGADPARQRIERAQVTFTGGVAPATAREVTTGAMTRLAASLAVSPVTASGLVPNVVVEVRVRHGEPLSASALAAAIESAVHRELMG